MSHYKPYPAYKDSGVEWIGKVPEHWGTLRIKRVANLRNERRNDVPDGWPYIGLEDVEQETGRYAPTEGNSRQSEDSMVGVFRHGDVLYGKLRPYLRKAIVTECDGVCSTEFIVLIASAIDSTWLHRWLLTPDVTQQIEAGCEGAKMPRADWGHVGSIPLPLPPAAEQTAITATLDRETARIDALIAKKTRFIELLQEKRQALITHAVTKGLDPSVKMKDSGVEWIGEVPGHWDSVKIARLGPLTKANGGSKQDNVDSGIPCIRYGEIYTTHEYVIRGSRSYISADKLGDYTPIQYGDVLFAASGETHEDIGKSAVNLLQEEACCGGDVIVLRPAANLDPMFLGYALDSMPSKAQKALMGKGYTVVHIYGDQLRDLIVALPPLFEQQAIGAAIDRETARIDALMAKSQRSIDLLKERRSALITAAVTGKINIHREIQ